MSSELNTGTGAARIPELDLMRFTAAFSVLAYHYVSCYLPAAVLADAALSGVAAVTRYGYLGVNVFFIISGYVILWSALGRTPSAFAIGRFVRLYPTFWVCVFLTIFALVIGTRLGVPDVAFSTSFAEIVANLTMWPSLFGHARIDDVYWTLEIELRFYVLVFLVLVLRQQQRVELFLYAWLAVLAVARFIELPRIIGFVAIENFGPYFVIGSFLFIVRARSISVGRAAAIIVATLLAMHESVVGRGGFITADVISGFVCPIVVALVVGYFLYLSLRTGETSSQGSAERLGALTYPLYLTHAGIGGVVLAALVPSVGAPIALVVTTAFAIALAFVLTVLVDVPVRRPLARILTEWYARLWPWPGKAA